MKSDLTLKNLEIPFPMGKATNENFIILIYSHVISIYFTGKPLDGFSSCCYSSVHARGRAGLNIRLQTSIQCKLVK